MKRGAKSPFNANGAGTKTVVPLLDAIAKNNGERAGGELPPIALHLVGHSTGAILLGWLLARLAQLGRRPKPRIATVHLLAPAASIDFYRDNYAPRLGDSATGAVVRALRVMNLDDSLERDDSVGPYRKSLLYLVSRAFEERKRERLLGMTRYAGEVPSHAALEVITSAGANGSETRSTSTTHGGFDNDTPTMNTVLTDIVGKTPERPFTAEDLVY
jgi:pimeloyl-ACP methyl ester carboxylesterase